MNYDYVSIYEELHRIYDTYRRKFKVRIDSKQMCLMWSANNPPDILLYTPPINSIEKIFNIILTEEESCDLFDMSLDEAAKFIFALIEHNNEDTNNIPNAPVTPVIQFTNRKNNIYYLHRGTTKSGKQKYYFSKNQDGILADAIPDGFEIYENLNAQVFLRRKESFYDLC